MVFRLISLALTLALVGYMFYAMNRPDNAVTQSIDNNPAVQEQKKALQGAGVDTSSEKSIADYTKKQAEDIKAYQDQLNNPPPKE